MKPDLDGDGKVEFGESVPDAGFYVAAARDFERYAGELDAAAREWEPTPSDALTALVVMTPTMSEYFEAWKNSRFIAGEQASENGVRGRLAAGGHRRHPRRPEHRVRQRPAARGRGRPPAGAPDRARASPRCTTSRPACATVRPPGASTRPRRPTSLGARAQEQAEAIAGQITQAAAKLNIEIQEG